MSAGPHESDGADARGADFIGPIVPPAPVRRDHVLAVLLCASLVVHVTILLPSFLRKSEAAAPPQEIPVEIVQLPPPPPKQPPPEPQQVAQKAPDPPKPQKAAPKQPKESSTEERLRKLLGPMAAIALPGNSPVGEDEVGYTQLVLSKVAKAKKEGRYKGFPGAAGVAFTIGDTGEVVKVEVVRPSGDPSLDAEAIAMIKRGAPYPPPPPGGRRDYAITLRFQPLI